ncbi:MAG TPA: hypothetical protein VMZ92_02705, partial [Planctomycetota bacterium]|nr:hypothetical protein [Planctomycetota bacterium]
MTETTSSVDVQPPAEPAGRGPVWPWMAVLVLLTLGVFTPALDTGTFVNGPESPLRISLLSHPRNIPTIFTQDFMIFTEGQYRPFSYALVSLVRPMASADHTLFWHLWLVGFHALNAVLVFAVVRLFVRRDVSAFAAAAVFALHPLASVFGNGMERFHHVLAASFYLGTLWCYVRFARGGRYGTYAAGVALFLCGLLTSKVLLTLPVLLLVYELLYARPGVVRAVARVLPFAFVSLVLSPCWLFFRPHPLFYIYPPFPAGSGWFSLYTFVGRTGVYLWGLASGMGFERPLAETVERVMTPYHAGFLLWLGVIVVGLVFAVHRLVRRRWLGLGIVLAGLGVVPYVSTVFHNTRDFISWDYLYLPLAGLAMAVGALVDAAAGLRRRSLRTAVAVVTVAGLGYYGVMLVEANVRT